MLFDKKWREAWRYRMKLRRDFNRPWWTPIVIMDGKNEIRSGAIHVLLPKIEAELSVSEDYPNGGMVEPYDIEREKELL